MAKELVVGDYIKVETPEHEKFCCIITRVKRGKQVLIHCVPTCEWIGADTISLDSDEEWIIEAFGGGQVWSYTLDKKYNKHTQEMDVLDPKISVKVAPYTRKKVIDFMFEMARTLNITQFEPTNLFINAWVQKMVESGQPRSIRKAMELRPYYVHTGTLYDKDRNLRETTVIQVYLTMKDEYTRIVSLTWVRESPWGVQFKILSVEDFSEQKPPPQLFKFDNRQTKEPMFFDPDSEPVERIDISGVTTQGGTDDIVSNVDIHWLVHCSEFSVPIKYDPSLLFIENLRKYMDLPHTEFLDTIVIRNAIGNPDEQIVWDNGLKPGATVSRGMDIIVKEDTDIRMGFEIQNIRHYYHEEKINDIDEYTQFDVSFGIKIPADIKLFGFIERIKRVYDTETRKVHSVRIYDKVYHKGSPAVLENRVRVDDLLQFKGAIRMDEAIDLYYSHVDPNYVDADIKLQWPIVYDDGGDDFISYVAQISLPYKFGRNYYRKADIAANPGASVMEPERDPRGLTKPTSGHITVQLCDAIWHKITVLAGATGQEPGAINVKDPNTLQLFTELNYMLKEWDKEKSSVDKIQMTMDGKSYVLWAYQTHNLRMPYEALQRGLTFELKGKVSIEVSFNINAKPGLEQDLSEDEKKFALGNLNGSSMFQTFHFRETNLVQLMLHRNEVIENGRQKQQIVHLNGRTQFGTSENMLSLCGYSLIKQLHELQMMKRDKRMQLIDDICIKSAERIERSKRDVTGKTKPGDKCGICKDIGLNCRLSGCGHRFHVGCIFTKLLTSPKSSVRYLIHNTVIPTNGKNETYTLYPSWNGMDQVQNTIYMKPANAEGKPPSMRVFYFDAKCPNCNAVIDPNPQVLRSLYEGSVFCGLQVVPLYKMLDELDGYHLYEYFGTSDSPWDLVYGGDSIRDYLKLNYMTKVNPIEYSQQWIDLKDRTLQKLQTLYADIPTQEKDVADVESKWVFNIKGKKLILEHPAMFNDLREGILTSFTEIEQETTIREYFVPEGYEISRVINMTTNKIMSKAELDSALETPIENIYKQPAWYEGVWPSVDCPINLMLQTKQTSDVTLRISYEKFSYSGNEKTDEYKEIIIQLNESFDKKALLTTPTDDIIKCVVNGSDDKREHSAAALRDAIRHTWEDLLLPYIVGFKQDGTRYLDITVERLYYVEPDDSMVEDEKNIKFDLQRFPYPTDVQYIGVNVINGDVSFPTVYKLPSWIYNPGNLPNYHKHIALFLQEYVTKTQDWVGPLGYGYYVPWAMTCDTNDGVRGIYLDGSFTFGNIKRVGFRDVESCLTGKTTLETMQWENMGFGALGLKNLDDVPRMVGRKRGIPKLTITGINMYVRPVSLDPTQYRMPPPYFNFMSVKLIDVGSAPTNFEIAQYAKQEEMAQSLSPMDMLAGAASIDPQKSPKIWQARQTSDHRFMRMDGWLGTYGELNNHARRLLERVSSGIMFEGVSFVVKDIGIFMGENYVLLSGGTSNDVQKGYIETFFSERYYKYPSGNDVAEEPIDWKGGYDSFSNEYFHKYCPYLFVFVEGKKNFETIFKSAQAQYTVFGLSPAPSRSSGRSSASTGPLSDPSIASTDTDIQDLESQLFKNLKLKF